MADKPEDKTESRSDEMVDKVLKHLDAMGARLDAMEMADKARRDAEDEAKADKARKDAEEAEKLKADAAKKDGDLEDGKKPGEPEDVVADKAKKDTEAEKVKCDAEEAEKAKADAQARMDADDVRKRIDAVEKMIPKQMSDADYAAMADVQARADSVAQAFGDSAPRPLQGEDIGAYRRRLAKKFQAHSERAKEVNLMAIHDEAGFALFEDMIYNDAQAAALKPTDLAHGELRPITRTDQHTGVRTTTFAGRGTFIGSMKRPAMRARINVRNGDRA